MDTKDYLKILQEEIHSTIVATVDEEGYPAARVIDMMLYDEDSLYFLTAKGKGFYSQLMNKPYVAISGMCGGEGTMNKKAVSIRGKVRCIGSDKLSEIFEKNPYMAEIYPTKESRVALEVFQVYEGMGEFFDLSVKPIDRDTFILGKSGSEVKKRKGKYMINHQCVGCGTCVKKCPQNCINTNQIPFEINIRNCLHCGNCYNFCKFGAVERYS